MLRLRKHIVAVGYVHIDLERPIRGLNLTPGQILSPFSSRFIASIIWCFVVFNPVWWPWNFIHIVNMPGFFFHACRISVSEHHVYKFHWGTKQKILNLFLNLRTYHDVVVNFSSYTAILQSRRNADRGGFSTILKIEQEPFTSKVWTACMHVTKGRSYNTKLRMSLSIFFKYLYKIL